MSRYEQVKQIGSGSYGKVYLMRDNTNGTLVVVKTIPLKAGDPKGKETAEKEARVLNMMQHPNVIAYHDSFFGQRGDFCIVLEYADGKDLQKYLETDKDVKERQVLQIFTQIILGLEYIHSQNILHRDIKTANVFLFRKGLVKLGDFGIAREVNDDQLAKTLIGTPYFMSPELLRGQAYGFPSDVWAAGCVLFETMTRKHAFSGKTREELFGNIIAGEIAEMPSQYSPELIKLLQQMLNRDPAKRPTCKEILQTPVVCKGLEELQARLAKHFGGGTKEKSSRRSRRTATEEMDDELDQGNVPEWLLDCRGVGEELIRQSVRNIEKDSARLLGVLRNSISTRKPLQAEMMLCKAQTITGNLGERKRRLEEDTRRILGAKYDIAYKFIAKYGQNRRDELLAQLEMSKTPAADLQGTLRLIETLTCIEASE